MKKARKSLRLGVFLITALLISAVFFTLFFSKKNRDDDVSSCIPVVSLTSDEQSKLDIVKDGSTDYQIIYSGSYEFYEEFDTATKLSSMFMDMGVSKRTFALDSITTEGAAEILIGNTNREKSKVLYNALVSIVPQDGIGWIIAEMDGKLYFVASSADAYTRGTKELFSFADQDSYSVPKGYYNLTVVTKEELDAEYEANKANRIEQYIKDINAFVNSDFTEGENISLDFTMMPSYTSGTPSLYPIKGEHPRVGLTPYMLASLKEYVNSTVEGKSFYSTLTKLAKNTFDGKLLSPSNHKEGRIGYHNVDEYGLAVIEARAFLYILTGDVEYGYNAILSMKNYLSTLYFGWIYSDQCREIGRMMFVMSEVYDWCYDLLSEADKEQLIIAATYWASGDASKRYGGAYEGLCGSGNLYMEVGYPPSKQGVISGHGTEAQILRDYLSFSIAIFDENSSWYNYVGGRIYNDFLPFREYYFTSDLYPQGVNMYASHRFNSEVWCGWLLLTATGENPYSDALRNVAYGFLYYQLPDGSLFSSGDSARLGKISLNLLNSVYAVAGMYGDSVLWDIVLDYYDGSLTFIDKEKHSTSFSFVHRTIFGALHYDKSGTTRPTEFNSSVDTLVYYSSPVGQMIARSSWEDASSPAIFMLIGERTTGNHDHADSGTFQIFYKGLYIGDSGVYDSYGSTHWKYYHQQTVAHNGLLIFNPDLADNTSDNLEKRFYSGGQRSSLSVGNTFESWKTNPSLDLASVVGWEYNYNTDGTPHYAYLAGDLTQAYSGEQASYVGRSMFTLFTGDEKYPMFFFVYDSIVAKSESFINKFLLHTPTEPIIDLNSKKVVIVDGEGKLVLNALKGAAEISAIGGENSNYLINGVQCEASKSTDDMWGRVEISSSGKLVNEFLNVMYVTDAANEEEVIPKMSETEDLIFTQVNKSVIAFAKSEERVSNELEFTVEGSGLYKYYVMGIYEGLWNIEIDGVNVAHCVSSEDGGLIYFVAPAGKVSIKPSLDVVTASNGGKIVYQTFGGLLPADAPYSYTIGETVTLPKEVSRKNSIFLGWYLSPNFEEDAKVTEILRTEKGKVTVYAKFQTTLIIEDYEDKSFDVLDSNLDINDLTYDSSRKSGSRFIVVKEDKNSYLRVTNEEDDLQIYSRQSPSLLLGNGVTTLTFEMDIAKDGDKAPLISQFDLRESTADKQLLTLFRTNDKGNVTMGGKTILTLQEKFQKLIVTVDFENATVKAYNKLGDVIGSMDLVLPSGTTAETSLEWLTKLKFIFRWYFSKNGESLLIDNLKAYEGAFNPEDYKLPEGTNYIIYDSGVASMPKDYSETYTVNEMLVLPVPTVQNGKFLGWYTDPNFSDDSYITEITATDATNPIALYAKVRVTFFENDFSDSSASYGVVDSVPPTANQAIDGITYQFKDKYANMYTETDALGNKYIVVNTHATNSTGTSKNCDPTLQIYNNSFKTIVKANQGKLTYEISLAAPKEGTCANTVFRLRATSGTDKDVITIFRTTASGEINIYNGTESIVIGTLTSALTKYAFTLDIFEETLTAYDEYGTVLATLDVVVPANTVTGATTVAEWFANTTSAVMQWYFKAKGTLAYDDLKIYSGMFEDYVRVPENGGKLVFDVGNGAFTEEVPNVYEAGVSLELPVPVANEKHKVFAGWYRMSDFSDEPITTLQTDEHGVLITLYAKYAYAEGVNVIEYVTGAGTLPETMPEIYVVGETIVIPDAISGGKYEAFGGWYDNPDFIGDPIKELIMENADKALVLYAKWVLPEGINRIEVNLGNANLDTEIPEYYEVGERIVLPVPTLSSSQFIGWFDNPDYSGDPITEINATTADEPIFLYALFKTEIFSQDFSTDFSTGVVSGTPASTNKTVDGVEYQVKNKYAFVESVDENGNKYIKVTTNATNAAGGTSDCDPSVLVKSSTFINAVLSNNGKLTYEIDLALPENGVAGKTVFRLRASGGNSSDVIEIFRTDASGKILLNGKSNKVVGTLDSTLTKYVFTLDVNSGMLAAYSESGELLASIEVAVPQNTVTGAKTVKEWFENSTQNVIQWYFYKNTTIAFDNIKIYAGVYKIL